MTLDEAARQLSAAGIENPRGEARLLLAHALGISREATLSLDGAAEDAAPGFAALVARRAGREPLAYITGTKEFWSLNFAVGPGVLVPRPDSETLIEEALRLFPDRAAPLRIADLGTGSGALLVAALHEFPHATGLGLEASQQAFDWGRGNAAMHAPGRAEILLADWSEAPAAAFDLIFCNPPYIPTAEIEALEPEVRLHEPRSALDGGPDGLAAYRVLAELLPRLLKRHGRAVLEMGMGQFPQLEPLFASWKILQIAPDLAGIPRALVLGPA